MEQTLDAHHQEKLFNAILSFPENRYCADCQALNPDWVSTTLGVLICYKCSGIHRSFGTPITRVKSTKLDSWTLEQMYVMGLVNNVESNNYWEEHLQEFSKIDHDSSPHDTMHFTRKKYVEKLFVEPGKESPAQKVRDQLASSYQKQEISNKNAFFQEKLTELMDIVKVKEEERAPRPSRSDKSGTRNLNKNKTLFLPKFTKKFSNITDRKDSQKCDDSLNGLVSPFLKPRISNITQLSTQNTIPSTTHLPLFKGLTIKTQNTIDDSAEPSARAKSAQIKNYHKSNTQQISSTSLLLSKNSLEPSSSLSKSNFTPFTSASKNNGFSGVYNFEEAKASSPKGSLHDIELLDMSEVVSYSGDNDKFSEGRDLNMMFSRNSVTTPHLFGEKKNFECALNEPHLKRPSEAFHVPKMINILEVSSTVFKKRDALWKGPVLFGCFMLHLIMGYIYSWGSIFPYIAEYYMRDFLGTHYLDNAGYNMLIFLGLAMGNCMCEKLANRFGMRTVTFGSFFGVSATMFLCSLTDNVMLYSGLMTIIPGFFIGLVYDLPFFCSSQYFQSHQIFLKGLFYIGNGIGAFLYSYLSYDYLSQRDLHGELEAPVNRLNNFYSDELVNNVPYLLRHMAIVVIVMGVIGCLLLHAKGKFIIRDLSGIGQHKESLLILKRQPTQEFRPRRKAPGLLRQGFKEALALPSTKVLFYLMVLSFMLSSFLLYSYKYLGILKGYSDAKMTLIGGVGMIILHCGKTVGAILHPIYGYKTLCKKIIMYQAAAGIALFLFSQAITKAFLGIFLLIMFFDGVLFSLIMEETRFVYHEDIEDSMVGLVILGYAISNFASFLIAKPFLALGMNSLILLALAVPLFFAYKISGTYSRVTRSDDTELVSVLLSI